MKIVLIASLCLVFGIVLVACQPNVNTQNLSAEDTVFENAQVIDVTDGSVTASHVVVRGDQIFKLLPTDSKYSWENATIVPLEGKYLLPGLTEMHAHIPALAWDDPLISETLFLYLSNGITTIRGMLGNPLHLVLR
jgi:cytosine/adenosine deaminase-related metal-dependent hydrolase